MHDLVFSQEFQYRTGWLQTFMRPLQADDPIIVMGIPINAQNGPSYQPTLLRTSIPLMMLTVRCM